MSAGRPRSSPQGRRGLRRILCLSFSVCWTKFRPMFWFTATRRSPHRKFGFGLETAVAANYYSSIVTRYRAVRRYFQSRTSLSIKRPAHDFYPLPGHGGPLMYAPPCYTGVMDEQPKIAEPKPKAHRRWYQFSLRTLLIFVTLAGCGFGWLGKEVWEARRSKPRSRRFGDRAVMCATIIKLTRRVNTCLTRHCRGRHGFMRCWGKIVSGASRTSVLIRHSLVGHQRSAMPTWSSSRCFRGSNP